MLPPFCVATFLCARFVGLTIFPTLQSWLLEDSAIMSARWSGAGCPPLDALTIRQLKTHLLPGNHALMGNGAEFLMVSAPDAKQPNTAKTGAVLHAQVQRIPSPVLAESFARLNRSFLTRAPYRHQTLFTCAISTFVATRCVLNYRVQ